MQTTKVLVYVKSLNAGNLSKAKSYLNYFAAKLGADCVEIFRSTPCRTNDISHLRNWVGALAADSLGEVVVIGGDGSVNIAATACVDTPARLTVIPSGTGNDFATALGLRDWRWRMRGEPLLRQRSVGSIADQVFINHAGAGISVALRGLQSDWSKRHLGRYSYLLALFRYLWVRPSRRFHIRDPQERLWEFQVAAVNREIGGGITVYPQAQLSTEVLGILQVPKVSRWQQLNALYWLLRKQPQRAKRLDCFESATFTLGDHENTIELDGDAVELRGPATAKVKVNALNVYTQGSNS